MNNKGVTIKKSYAFTFEGSPGGHISLTNDGRAVLVHLSHTDDQIKVFTDESGETADEQARKYVLENIDSSADFFEDPFLDLITWILRST
jgi:hypothetical protein